MPNIASFHPQIVHFIVVLGFVGVGLRLLSLIVRIEWIKPALIFLPAATNRSRMNGAQCSSAIGPSG